MSFDCLGNGARQTYQYALPELFKKVPRCWRRAFGYVKLTCKQEQLPRSNQIANCKLWITPNGLRYNKPPFDSGLHQHVDCGRFTFCHLVRPKPDVFVIFGDHPHPVGVSSLVIRFHKVFVLLLDFEPAHKPIIRTTYWERKDAGAQSRGSENQMEVGKL